MEIKKNRQNCRVALSSVNTTRHLARRSALTSLDSREGSPLPYLQIIELKAAKTSVVGRFLSVVYRHRKSEADKLKQVLSIVYSRVVFQDFRRPVGISYPSIHLHYNNVIAEPSDFGTLLHEALGETTGV